MASIASTALPVSTGPQLAFRVAFLTASTWNSTTATDTELLFALSKWTPETTVEHALAQLMSRRALERRGLLRKQEREAREAADA